MTLVISLKPCFNIVDKIIIYYESIYNIHNDDSARFN